MAKRRGLPKSIHSGIPRLPAQTPTDWDRVPLYEGLQEIRRPATLKPETSYRLVTVKRSRQGVEERGWLLGKEIKTKTQFYVSAGDFLISKRQIVHGACGLVPLELDGSVVSNEYAIVKSRGRLDLTYLSYLSQSLYFQQTCFHSSIGIHIEKMIFKLDQWLRWEYVLPPLPEQKRIVRILSTWDKAIETVEKLIENSKAQKKALMQQLLTGKRRLPGFSHPWEEVHLGRICTYSKGYTYKSDEYSERPTEHNFLTLKSIEKGGGFNRNGVKYLTHEVDTKYQVSSGDIVFAITDLTRNALVVGSPLHVPSLPGQSITISMDLVKLRVNPRIDRNFLFYLLSIRSLRNFMRARSHGSTVLHLDVRGSRKARLFIPTNINEQRAISSILNNIDKQISMYEQALKKHQVEKKALAQQLLTGKRRVKVDDS